MTDRWRHDRTGERVEDDDARQDRPRPARPAKPARGPVFEVTATWIDSASGRVASVIRSTEDQHELARLGDELRRAHGNERGFIVDVDVIDARGHRRALRARESLPSRQESKEGLALARSALRREPTEQPVESEVF